ncbi:MAG: glycogen debranching protein GlgX [Rhodospirillaceae bacterium]
MTELSQGHPAPLGAHWDGSGVNFALFSAHGEKVELCLFDDSGREERLSLDRTGNIWHGYVAGAGPGLKYGYRVHGPYAPQDGHRFNPNKLLIDPYAKALTGPVAWNEANHGYRFGEAEDSFDDRDNAGLMPKCVVTAAQDPAPPGARRPWTDSVIYELHVKGFTQTHPDVGEPERGRMAGLSAPAVLDYLTGLGVTAVELLPVFAFADEGHLATRGLTNYWGYNTYAFFTLDPRYGDEAAMRAMIAAYHAAGIEVILDVVFNHTAEGGPQGQTLSFRGIDNRSYYWAAPDAPGSYMDYSGCGNTFNVTHPQVQRLIVDSLIHWTQMGVDGFRFDLASVLGRGPDGFHTDAPLLKAITQAPALKDSKLIAEPWDIGGYDLGGFPEGWAEWNDRYRDVLRDYWRGEINQGALATRLAGSSDIFKTPAASVNFITAHDGFTLHDLVSYDAKHNEANGEDNRDGTDNNRSRNWGEEGPSSNPDIIAVREKQKRNMLACLLLSQGVPMLVAGDEFGRTQNGNNNAYCQDNPIGWVDWASVDAKLLDFVKRLIQLRERDPTLRRDHFFRGVPARTGNKDIFWLHPDGREITAEDWDDPGLQAFGFLLPASDADLVVLVNGGADLTFRLPVGRPWTVYLDTAAEADATPLFGEYAMTAASLAVLESIR